MVDTLKIDFYRENGYLIVNELFEEKFLKKLENKLELFNNHLSEPNVICEKNGEIRSIFSPQLQEKSFEKLYRDDRLIKYAEKIIGGEIYLYQYKLNLKKAFAGNYWEWHQDFPYWNLDDGVQKPQMVSIMILLNDTESYQGPLLIIPKSHKNGIAKMQKKEHFLKKRIELMDALNSDLKYTIDKDLVKKEALKNDIISLSGKKGTTFFFHPNIFHASNSNVSPFNRSTAIITYNSILNVPESANTSIRPDYICSRDFQAIKSIS